MVLECSEPPQGRVAEIVEKIAKSASFLNVTKKNENRKALQGLSDLEESYSV